VRTWDAADIVTFDFKALGDGDGYVTITARTIELTLLKSKTGTGQAHTVTVPLEHNASAVAAIEAWVTAGEIQMGSPLLRRVRKGDNVLGRLSAQSVNLILQSRIAEYHEKQGVPAHVALEEAKKFSGHSLRVGFATTAAESGADLRAIASVTRHKSLEMPQRYAQRADQIKTSPHNLAGVGLE